MRDEHPVMDARERPCGTTILKVLVGSRAHGLADEQSDYDYRGVFVQPTTEILKLGGHTRTTSWVEGRDVNEAGSKLDDTAWEIGHYLKMALGCNPTVLEVLAAPIVESQPEGELMRELLPKIWDPVRVRDSFVGYGLNQRKKLLEGKDNRPFKYATAYLRTLLQAETLLTYGVLQVDFSRHVECSTLMSFRLGLVTIGQVIDKCEAVARRVDAAMHSTTAERQRQDVDAVNAFLLGVRLDHWNA